MNQHRTPPDPESRSPGPADDGGILLVTGDAEALLVLPRLLQRSGRTRAVRTLGEAHAAIWTECPEILVADTALPDGDGATLIATVRAVKPWAQVLLLCDAVQADDIPTLVATGANDVAVKPFDVGGLDERMGHLRRAAQLLKRGSTDAAAEADGIPGEPASLQAYAIRAGGLTIPIKESEAVIGRSAYCTIPLDHPSVSRLHASLQRVGDKLLLRDLGSTNGTFVNDTRVAEWAYVQPGDSVRIGDILLEIRAGVGRPAGGSTRRLPASEAVDEVRSRVRSRSGD